MIFHNFVILFSLVIGLTLDTYYRLVIYVNITSVCVETILMFLVIFLF